MSYWEDEQRKREEEMRQAQAQSSMQTDSGDGNTINVIDGGLPTQEEIDRRRAQVEEDNRRIREAQAQYQPTADIAINQNLYNMRNNMNRNIDLENYAVASDIADSYLKQLQHYTENKRENDPEHVEVDDYREDFLKQKENELYKRMVADLNRQSIENGLRKKNIEEDGSGVRLGDVIPYQQGGWGSAAQGNQINPNFDHEWAQELGYTEHPNGGYSLLNDSSNSGLFDPFMLPQEDLYNGLANLSEYIDPYLIPGNDNLPTYDNLQYENFMHELYGDDDIEALMELENVRSNPYDYSGGSVDIHNRPRVPTSELTNAGWDNAGDGYATVFSSTYSNEDETDVRNFTPIVVDGNGKYVKSLSPDELQRYAESVIAGQPDILGLQIGGSYGTIDDAVNAAELLHEDQAVEYQRKPTIKELQKLYGMYTR